MPPHFSYSYLHFALINFWFFSRGGAVAGNDLQLPSLLGARR